ncbi:hypothetical protein F4V91_00530 [Neorhizobium galegae]|uniref:Uncharacterized protein n=1 Tax=Neorhizobium galegae TaxID=399 RepID=A0A6A1TKB5_NEOGA|nr:hypothetical protein [Neorhizobium galegae]KAB1085053.1 hypothetical protein F4V91_00530 [Neorhizobium galegae]
MALERSWLAMATFSFVADWMNADIQSEERSALYMERLEEITVSTAHFLDDDRKGGQSFAEEDERQFDQFLQAAALGQEDCAKAHEIRRDIILLANKCLDAAEARLENDPGCDPGCDPGGGMADTDKRDTDAPW